MNPSLAAVFRKELKLFFNTPVAFIATVIFLVFVGWFFNSTLFLENAASMRTLFTVAPFAFLFFIPALTMKLFSEELKSGTYDLLVSKPVTLPQVIAGKFLATMAVISVFLAPTLMYAVTIGSLAPLDWGTVIGGYLGLLLIGGIYTSVGIFTSTLTENQIVAFISGFVLCFLLYTADRIGMFVPSAISGFFQFLSVNVHFSAISRGVIDSRDLIYSFSMMVLFLTFSYLILLKRKEN